MKKTISRQLVILLCLVIAALAVGVGVNFFLNQKFVRKIEEEKKIQLDGHLFVLEESIAGLPEDEIDKANIEKMFYPIIEENRGLIIGFLNSNTETGIAAMWDDNADEAVTRIAKPPYLTEFDEERSEMIRPEVTRERDKIRSIRPVYKDGDLIGAIWIEDSVISDVKLFARVRVLTLFLVLFSGITGFFGAAYIIRKLMRDINKINDGIDVMKEDLGHRIDVSSGELGQVAMEINHMAEKLEEQKALEERLHQTDKLASLGQFVSGIAHELRNPLGIMKGSLQLMEREASLGEDDSKFLEIVYEQIERQNLAIEELLRFAKPAEPNFEDLEIDGVIDSIMSFAGAYLRDSSIELSREKSVDPITVNGDREKLKQVFLNLILNAAQAMPGGGSLSIKTEAVEGNTARIRFTDSGQGIPAESLPDIFNPYFTTKDEGTGLGLSISYQLVQIHGGTLKAENNEDGGASFTVSLPMQKGLGGQDV